MKIRTEQTGGDERELNAIGYALCHLSKVVLYEMINQSFKGDKEKHAAMKKFVYMAGEMFEGMSELDCFDKIAIAIILLQKGVGQIPDAHKQGGVDPVNN